MQKHLAPAMQYKSTTAYLVCILLSLTVATNSFHQNTQLNGVATPCVHGTPILQSGFGDTLPPPITVVPGTTTEMTSSTIRSTTSMIPTTIPEGTTSITPAIPAKNNIMTVVITSISTFISTSITIILVRYLWKILKPYVFNFLRYMRIRLINRTDETVIMEALNEAITTMSPEERHLVSINQTTATETTSFISTPTIGYNTFDVCFHFGEDSYYWDESDYNTPLSSMYMHVEHDNEAYENTGYIEDELPSNIELASSRSNEDHGPSGSTRRW